MGDSTNRAGRSMMEFGRIDQDAYQGGNAGALNNIEGMVRAIGGGAGQAGALTVAGVALHAFGPGLKAFAQSFVDANPKIKAFINALMVPEDSLIKAVDEAERRLKYLMDKPVKLAVDYREIETLAKRIEELPKAKRFLERFKNPPTEADRESSRRVNVASDACPWRRSATTTGIR